MRSKDQCLSCACYNCDKGCKNCSSCSDEYIKMTTGVTRDLTMITAGNKSQDLQGL